MKTLKKDNRNGTSLGTILAIMLGFCVLAVPVVYGAYQVREWRIGSQQATVAPSTTVAPVTSAPEQEPTLDPRQTALPNRYAPEDEHDLRLGKLTVHLTGWTPDEDYPGTHANSDTAEGVTDLGLYEAPKSTEQFVASYQDCGAPLVVKGKRQVGAKPAVYLEGTGCGDDQSRYNRVWLVASEGIAVVASSTRLGNINDVDHIIYRYAGWKN